MSDEHLNFDAAIAFLRQVYTLEGTDAAVQAAKDMIYAGAAWIVRRSMDRTKRAAFFGLSAPHKGKDCPNRPRASLNESRWLRSKPIARCRLPRDQALDVPNRRTDVGSLLFEDCPSGWNYFPCRGSDR